MRDVVATKEKKELCLQAEHEWAEKKLQAMEEHFESEMRYVKSSFLTKLTRSESCWFFAVVALAYPMLQCTSRFRDILANRGVGQIVCQDVSVIVTKLPYGP
jgi:hypothetical protein